MQGGAAISAGAFGVEEKEPCIRCGNISLENMGCFFVSFFACRGAWHGVGRLLCNRDAAAQFFHDFGPDSFYLA